MPENKENPAPKPSRRKRRKSAWKAPRTVLAGMTATEVERLKILLLGELATQAEETGKMDRSEAADRLGITLREFAVLVQDDPEFKAQIQAIKGADDERLADKARQVMWEELNNTGSKMRTTVAIYVDKSRGGYHERRQVEHSVKDKPETVDPVDLKQFRMKLVPGGGAVKQPEEAPASVGAKTEPHDVDWTEQ